MRHARTVVVTLAAGVLLGWVAGGCQGTTPQTSTKVAEPAVHHILLEVADIEKSFAFYRDHLGFRLQSNKGGFAILKGANIDVYLWNRRWDWEKKPAPGERAGLGMYPHLEIDDVPGLVGRLKKAGYKVPMDTRTFNHGHEAFVSDPDGYTWSLISPQKDPAGTRR